MPIGDLLAQITGEPSPTEPTPTEPTPTSSFLPPKRKADEQLKKPVNKFPRTRAPGTTSSRPVSNNAPSLSVEGQLSRVKLGTPNQRPLSSSSPSATFKNGRPTPPLVRDAPRAPPKKGSFAEIMARGKAAQSTLGQVGKIQHKKIEKLPSKRDREEMKTQRSSNLSRNLAPGSKFNKASPSTGRDGKNGFKENGKKAPPEPEKKVKKAATATTGYAGTARPRPGGASGPARSSGSGSRYDRGPDRNRYRVERHGSGPRYAYVSEEEEEEEEEEREYDSDVSSDMEAAAFEVDEEEEAAARIARQEDAAALAEENRLKREKEEKRRRLAAMAKSRR